MRILSPASAVVHVALLGVVAIFAFGVGSAPFENQSAESEAAQGWVLTLAPVVAVLAITFARAAATRNVKLMVAAWLVEFFLVVVTLVAALVQDPRGGYHGGFVVGAVLILSTGGVATATVRDEKS